MRMLLYVVPALLLCLAPRAEEEAAKEAPAGEAPAEAQGKTLSTDVLKSHLERWGIRDYVYDDEFQAFFFTLVEDGQDYVFHLRLFGDEDRGFLLVAARYVVEGEPAEGEGEQFFRKMAVLNYGLLLARAGWDEETKEVACDYVMPVSGGLAYQDFSMAMSGVVSAAMETRKALKPLLKAAAPAPSAPETVVEKEAAPVPEGEAGKEPSPAAPPAPEVEEQDTPDQEEAPAANE